MRKRLNPDSEQNIKRIDTKPRAKKQTHGFQVHFVRGSSTGTKMFSDAVYGGKEQARKAARKHRRDTMGDLPARTTLMENRQAAKTPARPAAAKKATPAKKAPAAKAPAPKTPAAKTPARKGPAKRGR
jgi:hypothetical protein